MYERKRNEHLGAMVVAFSMAVFFNLSLSEVVLARNFAAEDRVGAESRFARKISPNTVLRHFHPAPSECFEIELESRGYLLLDVVPLAGATIEAKIDVTGRALPERGDEPEPGLRFLDRSATSVLGEAQRPGGYVFCVAAQDPSSLLEAFKLQSIFVERAAMKDGDPEEDEPPPDPNVPPLSSTIAASICEIATTDDHGDVRLCGTPLLPGHAVDGEIWNGWGDDGDYFALLLPRLVTLSIETTGVTDTLGSLFDPRGHLIAEADDGGAEGNFRLVKTLSPGLYFVRVTGGHQAEGAYRMKVERLR